MTTPLTAAPVTFSLSMNAAAFPVAELPLVEDAVNTELSSSCAELGMPIAWAVAVTQHQDAPLCRAYAGTTLLLLSARRDYRVTAGVVGRELAPEAERSVDGFMVEQARALTPEDRCALATELVRARLLANLAVLRGLVLHAGPDSAREGPSQALAGALDHAARLGVAPVRLTAAWSEEASSEPDPLLLCESLLERLQLDQEPPVIEMSQSTLRWMTTSPNLVRPWSTNPPGPNTSLSTTVGTSSALWNVYGVTTPGCVLRVQPFLRDNRFRFQFGEIATSQYLLLPDDVIALSSVDSVGDKDLLGWTLDPVGGGWWPLVPAEHATELPEDGDPYVDSIGLLMRTLYSEMEIRLARWAPGAGGLDELNVLADPLASALRSRYTGVTRCLLADGVSVPQPSAVLEGVTRGLAVGASAVGELALMTRKHLGGAVLGHAPPEHPRKLVRLDPQATASAARSQSVEPLIDAHRELLSSTSTLVAVCPAEDQAVVTSLLRPLADGVRVASHDEIATAAMGLPATQGT